MYIVLANREFIESYEISNSRTHNIHQIPIREKLDKKITLMLSTYFLKRKNQEMAEIKEQKLMLPAVPFNIFQQR